MYSTLIDVHTLQEHLHHPDWVVVDCRFNLLDKDAGLRDYQAGHIPGARYAHLDHELSAPATPETGRHPLPTRETFAATLGAWGIDQHTQVVAYDIGPGSIAGRLWWMLRWLGSHRCAVLDGGLKAWQQAGFSLDTVAPSPEPRQFVPAEAAAWAVDTATLAQDTGGAWRVLDARTAERFRGEAEPIDPVAGHIPGALSAPLEANLQDGRFLPPEALRARFEGLLQGRDPATVVHSCGSGVSACHNLLAMELAGLRGSRLYPGSWSEWIRDPARPVATGD